MNSEMEEKCKRGRFRRQVTGVKNWPRGALFGPYESELWGKECWQLRVCWWGWLISQRPAPAGLDTCLARHLMKTCCYSRLRENAIGNVGSMSDCNRDARRQRLIEVLSSGPIQWRSCPTWPVKQFGHWSKFKSEGTVYPGKKSFFEEIWGRY